MGILTDQIKKTINEVKPALVATSSPAGKPNVSAKGSFRVIDDDTVAFADVASPRTIANLKENSQISLIVLGNETNKGFRMWGTGSVENSGEIFDQFASDFSARNMTINNVVVITVLDVEV